MEGLVGRSIYELNVYSWTCCFYVIKVLSGWCIAMYNVYVHVGECWIMEDHKVQKVGGIIIIFCNNWKFGWLVYVRSDVVESIRLHEVARALYRWSRRWLVRGYICIKLHAVWRAQCLDEAEVYGLYYKWVSIV